MDRLWESMRATKLNREQSTLSRCLVAEIKGQEYVRDVVALPRSVDASAQDLRRPSRRPTAILRYLDEATETR